MSEGSEVDRYLRRVDLTLGTWTLGRAVLSLIYVCL